MTATAMLLALAVLVAPHAGILAGGAPGAGAARAHSRGTGAGLPASALGQISAALGADDPAYRVGGTAGSSRATNPAQALGVSFSAAGTTFTAQSLSLNLSLKSFGFGASQQPLEAVSPKASRNGATYSRPQLSEWYRNGPLGVEQGFTVAHAPAAGSGPLALVLGLSGNAHATRSADGSSVTLGDGSTSLRYGGLSASDAAGRTLASRISLRNGELVLSVDAAGARYPLTIDPLIQQGDKLTGGEEQGEARFGTSAAVSTDGSTILIGGPSDNNFHGAAWVFTRNEHGSVWTQQAKLTTGEAVSSSSEEQCDEEAGEEAGECSFGSSVALSADGSTALVGAPSSTALAGAAFVFTREGGTWAQAARLTGPNETGEGRFGRSVALSASGETALVGDPSAETQKGAAWAFTRAGAGWGAGTEITGPEGSHLTHFGRGVSLSSDGKVALIGGPGYHGFMGAAWAYEQFSGTWSPLGATLTGTGATGEAHFGKSVALSGDGSTALIGGLNDNSGRGAVWAFARSGSLFLQQGKKLVGEEEGSHFGAALSLSNGGETGLVGSPHEEHGLGTVTVLVRSGSEWTRLSEQLAGTDAAGRGQAGMAVALSGDGRVAVSGAPRDNARVGGAWVFANVPSSAVLPPTVTGVTPSRGSTAGGREVTITGTNLNAAQAVHFGAVAASSFEVRSATTIKALTPAAPAGTVDVTVTTPIGTSPLAPPFDRFTFESPSGEGAGTATGTGTVTATSGVLGSTGSAGSACRVTLRSRRLAVALRRSAALRLLRTGSGECRGKVTLRYKVKLRGGKFKLKAIGSASFSIAPGASQVIRIRLNKAGRALFLARHGRLNASLAIVRVMPAPTLGKTASVRLSIKKTSRSKSTTK